MMQSRNTKGVSALAYLDWIQRGSTQDWRRLYMLCKDPNVALRVAAVLPMRDPDLLPSALVWKFLLEDLHPELHLAIDLGLDKQAVGV